VGRARACDFTHRAGDIVAPGFIDLQVNGLAGNDGRVRRGRYREISRQLSKYG